MKYTKTEIIELLLHAGLIVPVSKGYLINSKLQKIANTKHVEDFCKNFPKSYKGLTDAVIYQNVINDCRIPSIYDKDIRYHLRTKSTEAIIILKMLLRDTAIDYHKFMNRTKNFYNSDMVVPSFSNYLVKGKWELVYNDKEDEKEKEYSRKGAV